MHNKLNRGNTYLNICYSLTNHDEQKMGIISRAKSFFKRRERTPTVSSRLSQPERIGGVTVTDVSTGESIKTTTNAQGQITKREYRAAPRGRGGSRREQLGEQGTTQIVQEQSVLTKDLPNAPPPTVERSGTIQPNKPSILSRLNPFGTKVTSTLSGPSYIAPTNVKDIQGPTYEERIGNTIYTRRTGGSVKITGEGAFDVSNEQALESYRTGKPIIVTRNYEEALPSEPEPVKVNWLGQIGVGVAKTGLALAEFQASVYYNFFKNRFTAEEIANNPYGTWVKFPDSYGGGLVGDIRRQPNTFFTLIPQATAVGYGGYNLVKGGIAAYKTGGVGGVIGTIGQTFSPFRLTPKTYYADVSSERQLSFVKPSGDTFTRVQGSRNVYIGQRGYVNPQTNRGFSVGFQATRQQFIQVNPSGSITTGTEYNLNPFGTQYYGGGKIYRGYGPFATRTGEGGQIGINDVTYGGGQQVRTFAVSTQVRQSVYKFGTGNIQGTTGYLKQTGVEFVLPSGQSGGGASIGGRGSPSLTRSFAPTITKMRPPLVTQTSKTLTSTASIGSFTAPTVIAATQTSTTRPRTQTRSRSEQLQIQRSFASVVVSQRQVLTPTVVPQARFGGGGSRTQQTTIISTTQTENFFTPSVTGNRGRGGITAISPTYASPYVPKRFFTFELDNFAGLDLPSNVARGGRKGTQYVPSLSAYVFRLTGKYKKSSLTGTGLDFRPILIGVRRRRRRR